MANRRESDSSFLEDKESDKSNSPLLEYKKLREYALDEKLNKVKQTSLQESQNSKRIGDKKYRINSYRTNLSKHQATDCAGPVKKIKTQKTTPVQQKKLIKTRFKENMKIKEKEKTPISSPSKKGKATQRELKSRNKQQVSHGSFYDSSMEGTTNLKIATNKFNLK